MGTMTSLPSRLGACGDYRSQGSTVLPGRLAKLFRCRVAGPRGPAELSYHGIPIIPLPVSTTSLR